MTKHILLVTLLQLSITSFGQNFIWSKNIGSTGNDGGNAIQVTQDGDIYSCGFFYDSIDIDPGDGVTQVTSAGSADMYIMKQNTNGDLVWAKTIGGSGIDRAYSLDYDMDGNIYVTGQYYGTVDFDPGSGVLSKTSNGMHDIFLMKMDQDGNMLWAITIGGAATDFGRALTIGQDGQVYLTGFYSETVDFDPGVGNTTYSASSMQFYDVFISKYSVDGDLIWAKSIGGPGMEDAFCITTNTWNEVYITGYFEETTDFDPGVSTSLQTSNGAYDAFVLKLDADGNHIWNKTMGGVGNDITRAVACDNDGNIICTGSFTESFDADAGPDIVPFLSAGLTDAFVVKMDVDGQLVWAQTLGGTENDETKTIAIDFEGNYYLSGSFGSTIEIESPEFPVITAVGGTDIFIEKLHPDGSLGWVQTLGGPSFDLANSVVSDASGSIYITGNYSDNADFDPGSNAYNMTSNGGSDIYLTKLCYAQLPQDVITGTSEVCDNDEVVFGYIESPFLVNYTWNLPEGAMLISGQNTPEARFTFTQPVNQVILTTQNACGMVYESTYEVISHDIPEISIDAYPGTTVCSGEPITLTANGAENFTWEDGVINGENFNVETSREYVVTATNGGFCTATASIAIEVQEAPQIVATANLTTVCGNGEVILSASGANDIAWVEGVNSGEPVSITETRTFHAIAMSSNGCMGAAEITIHVHPLPVIEAQATDAEICHGNGVTLFASGTDNVMWSNGISNNETVTLNQTTTFTVATTDEYGCTGYDDITIIVHQAPEIVANASATEICHGSAVTLSGSGGENFQWSNGVNNEQPFNLLQTTTFTVTGMSEYGCIGEDEITINVHEVPVITAQPEAMTAVVGNDTQFSIQTEFPADSYRWQRSNGTGFENIENDAVFSGVNTNTLQIHNPGEELDGNYFRCIITSGPCTEFSEVGSLTMTPDGVVEVTASLIHIYPNPADDMINMTCEENLIGSVYQIFDQTGRMVDTHQILNATTQIDIQALSAGIYTLAIPGSMQNPIRFIVK